MEFHGQSRGGVGGVGGGCFGLEFLEVCWGEGVFMNGSIPKAWGLISDLGFPEKTDRECVA